MFKGIQIVFLALTCASCAFIFSNCGGGNAGKGVTLTKHVPANASAVFVFNVKQLMDKADFETVKQMDFYKDGMEQAPELAKPFLKDLKETGLDLDGQFMGFVSVDEKNPKDVFVAMLMPIKDSKKFDALIEKAQAERTNKAEDKKTYKIIKNPAGLFLAWNNQVVAFGGSDPTLSTKDAHIEKLFKPEGADISSNTDFANHLKENKDALVWFTGDHIAKALLDNPETGATIKATMPLMGLTAEMLMGNTMGAFYDFQNGKAEGGAYYKFNGELAKEFGNIFKAQPTADFSKYVPAKDLAGIFTLALDMNAVYEALNKRRLTVAMDGQLRQMGLTSQEIFAAFKGDMLVAGFASATPAASGEPQVPNVVFVMDVANKATIEKLIKIGSDGAGVKIQLKDGKFTIPAPGGKAIHGLLTDEVLMITTVQEIADKAGAYAGGESASSQLAQIQKGWSGTYIDYANWIKMSDPAGSGMYVDSMSLIARNVFLPELVSGVNLADNKQAKATVNIKTTDKNSLKRFMELLNEFYKQAKAAGQLPS